MPNENSSAAQNKMGELFVDIGTSGLGKTLKGLNSLNATFLLAKKGAEEFVKPITKVWKETNANVLSLKKMSTALGSTFQEVHKLRTYLNQKGLSEGLIDDLGSLQDKLYDISHGFAGMDSNMARTLNILGLDITKYDGSLESTIEMVNDMKAKMEKMNMSALDKAQMFRGMRLSKEFTYAIERGDIDLSEYKSITDEQINAQLQSQEKWKKFTTDFQNFLMEKSTDLFPKLDKLIDTINKNFPTFVKAIDTLIDKGIPLLTKSIGLLSGIVEGFSVFTDKKQINIPKNKQNEVLKQGIKNTGKGAAVGTLAGAAIGSVVPVMGTAAGAVVGGAVGSLGSAAYTAGKYKNIKPEELQSKQLKLLPMTSKQEKAYNGNDLIPPLPKHLRETSYLPPALKFNTPLDMLPSQTTKSMFNDINVVINNENKISSTDPTKAAKEMGSINTSEIEHSISLAFVQNSQQGLIS